MLNISGSGHILLYNLYLKQKFVVLAGRPKSTVNHANKPSVQLTLHENLILISFLSFLSTHTMPK